MITYTRSLSREKSLSYVIYEPSDAIPVGIIVIPWQNMRMAMKGNHVRDVHGKVIPILFRKLLKRKSGQDLMLVFPGQTWIASKHSDRPFAYTNDPNIRTSLTAPQRMFASLLANGVQMDDAFRRSFPKVTSRGTKARMMAIFANREFMFLYLEETGLMSKIKDMLAERGITQETMVDRLVDLLDDAKAPANLRKYALETLWEEVNEKEKPKGTINNYIGVGNQQNLLGDVNNILGSLAAGQCVNQEGGSNLLLE